VEPQQEARGRLVREAWIAGVKSHFPGEPKASYITSWEEMPDWERAIVVALYDQVRGVVLAGVQPGQQVRLTPEQGGRLVRVVWVQQVYKHFPDPKETYVQAWEQMPEWERQTDTDMFAAIEGAVLREVVPVTASASG
jgi:hypothetical protein